MLLEHTISQLDVGYIPREKAIKLGHLGYLQWLGAMPGGSNYKREAMHAYELARPFAAASPAVAEFCNLLVTSAAAPLSPLDLIVPQRVRRGGAKARRDAF